MMTTLIIRHNLCFHWDQKIAGSEKFRNAEEPTEISDQKTKKSITHKFVNVTSSWG